MTVETIDNIAGVILTSIIISGTYLYFTEREEKANNNILLNFLWITGIFFIGYIASFFIFNITMNDVLSKVLAPIGIIIASFIASASVIKSILSSKKLQEKSIVASKSLQKDSIRENRKLQEESIAASKQLQIDSIDANKKLKKEEQLNEHKSQLDFMLHICEQSLYSIHFIYVNKLRDDRIIHVEYAVNNATEWWERLFVDKYFIFINDDASDIFHKLNNDMKILRQLLRETNKMFESNDEAKGKLFKGEIFNNTVKSLSSNIEEFETSLTKQRDKMNL